MQREGDHPATARAASVRWLPQWLRRLEADAPGSRLEVHLDVLSQCEAAMLAGGVQFILCHAHALVPGRLRTPDFDRIVVEQDTLHCVGAPDALSRWTPHTMPLLHYSETSGLGRILLGLPAVRGELPQAQVVFTAHLATMLRSMALEGRGVAYLPDSLIDADLRAGTLRAAPSVAPVALDTRLYRASATLAPPAQALWEAARALAP